MSLVAPLLGHGVEKKLTFRYHAGDPTTTKLVLTILRRMPVRKKTYCVYLHNSLKFIKWNDNFREYSGGNVDSKYLQKLFYYLWVRRSSPSVCLLVVRSITKKTNDPKVYGFGVERSKVKVRVYRNTA